MRTDLILRSLNFSINTYAKCRLLGSVVILCFFAAINLSYAGEPPQSVKYRFGLSSTLSGPWAAWGTPIKNGALLAAKYSKNKIELDIQDDRGEPRVALTNLQRFQMMEGQHISIFAAIEAVEVVAPVARRQGGIVLSLGGMSTEILKRNQNVTNFYALADNEIYYLVPYWTKVEKFKRLSILRGNWSYGESFGTALDAAATKAGMTVVSHDAVDISKGDISTSLSKAALLKPDVIFVHQGPEGTGIAIRRLRELGYRGAIYSGFYAEYEETSKSAGSMMNGVRFSTYSDPHGEETAYTEFKDRFRAEFGMDPNYESTVGYDAVQLLDRALTRCAGANPACVQGELRKTGTYRGVSGSVTIHPDGSATRPFGIKEYRDGKCEWVARHVESNAAE